MLAEMLPAEPSSLTLTLIALAVIAVYLTATRQWRHLRTYALGITTDEVEVLDEPIEAPQRKAA